MQLLWIILRWLFPADPVRQCAEALRQHIAHMIQETFSENALRTLERCPDARIYLESILIDYEASLQLVIGGRACQIAGIHMPPAHRAFYRPVRARSLLELLARIGDLAAMCEDIERLAHLRAAKLTRERDADPLSLRASGPLRLAVSQRATSPSFAGGGPRAASSLAEGGGGGSCTFARETEGAARYARGPPVPHSPFPTPQPRLAASPARAPALA